MKKALKGIVNGTLRKLGYEVRAVRTEKDYPWFAGLGVKTIFDIGANTGQFAAWISGAFPGARLYSFEPLKDCYEELARNLRAHAGARAFNFALADADGEREFHRSTYAVSSSLLPMGEQHKRSFPVSAGETIERVTVRRLDSVIEELLKGEPLEDPILVKIDVQGAEDAVIRGGERLIRRAGILILETSFQPLYEGQPLFGDIHDLVRGLGFAFAGNVDQLRDPIDGRILQADSIFLRRI